MKVNKKGSKKYEYVAHRFDNVILCKKCYEDNLPMTKEDVWEEQGESIPCSECGATIEAVPPKRIEAEESSK